ncbi:glycosyl transferase [Nadsonia fulvescens var. elongata DSM 6958]|uniref:Glycosyl transferase n=1 Tax=Nadsonia fulvescens var. elongata DSM 6958 TaxID=857566 RepID=A0A1E3PQV0_9ASCO|nr:glycosyl transferase [Nadsonia fulvescens var. elongata DSM 6958]
MVGILSTTLAAHTYSLPTYLLTLSSLTLVPNQYIHTHYSALTHKDIFSREEGIYAMPRSFFSKHTFVYVVVVAVISLTCLNLYFFMGDDNLIESMSEKSSKGVEHINSKVQDLLEPTNDNENSHEDHVIEENISENKNGGTESENINNTTIHEVGGSVSEGSEVTTGDLASTNTDSFSNTTEIFFSDFSSSLIEKYSDLDNFPDHTPAENPFSEKIEEPPINDEFKLVRSSDKRRVKGALISLCRNEEAKQIASSVRQVEEKFNSKFKYPWIFFNDEEFSEFFKATVSRATDAETRFIKIDSIDWEEPEHINMAKAEEAWQKLADKGVQYSKMKSYHRMCRWFSGKIFTNPALDDVDYYWRVEPKTSFYCNIDYDVFAYMKDKKKIYGFNINLFDSPYTVETLLPTTLEFLDQHRDYLHDNNSFSWSVHKKSPKNNDIAHGYSTCHFWTNFEIVDVKFFRSKEYQELFEHLDKAGGFFYERWGDAPVRSLALSILADREQIHWFRDIGYTHDPYSNCPNSDKCVCEAGSFASPSLDDQNCMNHWLRVAGTSWD